MDKKILTATHDGKINMGQKELTCAVLEDGTRIIRKQAVFEAFDRPARGSIKVGSRVAEMPSFIDANNLQPYISSDLMSVIKNPLTYIIRDGTRENTGYDAKIIPLLCDVYLEARKNNALTSSQLPQAAASEILVRSLAKVGIIALVDEATGYQYDREKDELQKLLKKYVSEELLPWQKTFPDIYYRELFRLNGWDFTIQGIKKRPSCIGTWTNKLIYEQLPPGVLDDLKKRTPKTPKGQRTHRFFQLLTEDIGSPHLREQINQIVTLFQLSDNMKHMWGQFKKLKLRQMEQMELPFEFDEKGYTIVPVEVPLSPFNKKLKKALDYSEK